ncbi:M48 family metalloprotease [Nocardia sp. NPDC088792]|uniref:M48 family metalloprotease n=1 Tax=Nocardia sp. NPDC088792 TaxID=3364332 RepID=UPI00380A648C
MSSRTTIAARPGDHLGRLRARRRALVAAELILISPELVLSALLIVHFCAPHGALLGIALGMWALLAVPAGFLAYQAGMLVPPEEARFPDTVPESEKVLLAATWHDVAESAGLPDSTFTLAIQESEKINGSAYGRNTIRVTRAALQQLPPLELHAMVAHELGHHLVVGLRGPADMLLLLGLPVAPLELPQLATHRIAERLLRHEKNSRVKKLTRLGAVCTGLPALFGILAWLFGPVPAVALMAVTQGAPLSRAILQRHREFAADGCAVDLGYGTGMRDLLRMHIGDLRSELDPYTALFLPHPSNRRRIRRIEARLRVLESRWRP